MSLTEEQKNEAKKISERFFFRHDKESIKENASLVLSNVYSQRLEEAIIEFSEKVIKNE